MYCSSLVRSVTGDQEPAKFLIMEEHEEGIRLRESQTPYIYNALHNPRDIRLLSYQYLPDENEVTIQCNLITKSLDEIISLGLGYWALSYVWGNPNDTVAIICDGQRLSITRNLHALLVNLFETDEMEKPQSGYVWADAICINQRDDEEKTLQVRLMQDIFSHADHVVAWLGEDSESVRRAFAPIRQIFALMEKYVLVNPETQEEYFHYDSLDTTEAEAIRSGMPRRNDKVWSDIALLMSNSWFSRVWVVQEALMAKTMTFLCGTTTLPAKILFPVADHMMELDVFHERLPAHLLASWFMNASYLGGLDSRHRRGDTLKIFDILSDTQNFEASDTRDKVFAVVGLATDIDDTFIDYSQKDPGPMLVRLAKHILGIPDQGGASYPFLEMVGYAGSTTAIIDVPSWVADWTSSDTIPTLFWDPFCYGDDDDPNLSGNERTSQFAQVTEDNVSEMMSYLKHCSLCE